MRASLTQEFEAKLEEKLQERLSQQVAEEVQAYLTSMNPRMSPNPKLPIIKELEAPLSKNSDQEKVPRVIEVPNKCHLALNDEYNENLVVVADGTTHPCSGQVTHNLNMKPDHYRVSVDYPYPDYALLVLPVESPDGVTKLGKSKNYIVQWPAHMVF